ncbi:natural resistance-associated macrophage protein [Microthyrium microscopicum]|uniref:Natural resistance-associated macrophage protein n=1 Tax=Microthyrium microscopicum TaxID=703497 RepID=A0A6A6TU66_9PEZI|nr:natural resistance-associated macrophage protein [Microthyrium microscopicum]
MGTRGKLPPREVALLKLAHAGRTIKKFGKFIGPGFMVAVAYIDPGNYATDIAAGADSKFSLLFMVLLSNLIAIFFQTLCIKMGSVTGGSLGDNCREHLPKWMFISLYIISEIAIIATDFAEVIGTAIAITLLFKVNIIISVGLTILDVIFVLIFYRPKGASKGLQAFEYAVAALVLTVVVSFCVELSLLKNTNVGEVFLGYLPSKALVEGRGLYLACGILGATVMPHSLFLGSGMVQPRLQKFDEDAGLDVTQTDNGVYRPTLNAIDSCMKYSIAELTVQLFTFALFVNSAILIVAGASLFGNPAADTDLFGIFDLLNKTIAPAAGIVFALALLMSGISAGIVCTVASQISTEGFMQWKISPWVMRLITRILALIPAIAIAAKGGKDALGDALTGSQVILSILLPVISAPLVYITCRQKYMTVSADRIDEKSKNSVSVTARMINEQGVDMSNGLLMTISSVGLWLVVAVMNIALLALIAMGKA